MHIFIHRNAPENIVCNMASLLFQCEPVRGSQVELVVARFPSRPLCMAYREDHQYWPPVYACLTLQWFISTWHGGTIQTTHRGNIAGREGRGLYKGYYKDIIRLIFYGYIKLGRMWMEDEIRKKKASQVQADCIIKDKSTLVLVMAWSH